MSASANLDHVEVYPRVGGGTISIVVGADRGVYQFQVGLSPRGRGNPLVSRR